MSHETCVDSHWPRDSSRFNERPLMILSKWPVVVIVSADVCYVALPKRFQTETSVKISVHCATPRQHLREKSLK